MTMSLKGMYQEPSQAWLKSDDHDIMFSNMHAADLKPGRPGVCFCPLGPKS